MNARSASGRVAPVSAPSGSVSAAAASRCACGGSCPRCEGARLHPSAAEITAPLHARAVTIGQDVYFQPGQYRPGTPEGDALIAHELAHTRQTRHTADHAGVAHAPSDDAEGGSLGSPSRAELEANADALAAGVTSHVLAAPPGAALLTPVGETSDQKTRRMAAAAALRLALAWIPILYKRGRARPAGGGLESSRTAADARLTLVVRNLLALIRLVESGPVPAGWYGPLTGAGTGHLYSYERATQAETDACMFYAHWAFGAGRSDDEILRDFRYIVTDPLPSGRATRPGYRVIVKDPEHDPDTYQWSTGHEGWQPKGSMVLEVWRDDVGYYYEAGGRKIYVPQPR